ncbi:MAG: hypothetical protein M5U28_15230 [Sandaracinaceae bacterium]|nr:hypothetical protein [Sandaracinaceae bacterium]
MSARKLQMLTEYRVMHGGGRPRLDAAGDAIGRGTRLRTAAQRAACALGSGYWHESGVTPAGGSRPAPRAPDLNQQKAGFTCRAFCRPAYQVPRCRETGADVVTPVAILRAGKLPWA